MAVSTVSLPPGPGLPRLVQTLLFVFRPVRFIDGARRRYGDVVSFSTSFDPHFVMVFDPEIVKQVFRAPPERLRAGEANAVLGPLLGERSVLLLDGAEHLRQRRLLLPPFHGERLRAYEDAMREAADRAIDAWPVGEPFALLPSMQGVTLDVIATVVFGVERGPRADELKRRVRAAIEPLSRRLGVALLALSGGRLGQRGAVQRFNERKRALDAMIYDEIARRRAAPDLAERGDVMSTLLLARDEQGEPMSDAELRDELVTLLVAGHETTATGLAWAFDLLLHEPRVLGRLRGALDQGDGAYLEAVVKEALRLRPVVPGIGRVVREEPFELDGWRIPVGMEINPSISVIHRRGDRYEQPQDFRPERFLGDDAPDTYTWIPFGGGTRRCLGASFALLEMRIAIARVLERTRLEPASPERSPVLRRGITLVPADGVRVVQPEAPAAA